MYKQMILTYLMKYLELKHIPIKKSGNVTMIKCPLCNKEPMSANIIPNTHIIHCFGCEKEYTIIEIARHIDFKDNQPDEENLLHHLKELLKIDIMTKTDETNLEEYLDFYVKNGFDLVPIAKDAKIPIEKKWTQQEHKDKEDWKTWLANGLNMGIKTGIRSNITILDIDQKPIPEEIIKFMGKTLMQESTNGYHLFYQYEEELPKTRIDDLKIDIENDGGQVVIYPSKVKGISRKINNLCEITKMSKELKELIKSKVKKPKQTFSEKIVEDIQTEDFKIKPSDFALKNNNLEGCCNSSFIKLGGIFRKNLNIQQTSFVLHTLNRHLLENPMDSRAITSMVEEINKYVIFDEEELAEKVLDYLRDTDEANRTEIAMAVAGTNRGEDKKRIDKTLKYLVNEGHLIKKGARYCIIKKAQWKESLIDVGIPLDFKMPYFHDVACFNYGDLVLIGSKNKKGKTHISMNIVKQLVKQGKKPYYISLETGSRFAKIALQLGLKEGDFKWDFHSDPTQIELEQNGITIIDWLCPQNFAETDKLFMHFIEQLHKTQGFLIVFMQLKDDNEWFARNMVKQFPSLASKYLYDKDDDGTYGKFKIDVIREPKLHIKSYEIPCVYDWMTKELKRVDDLEKEKSNGKKIA